MADEGEGPQDVQEKVLQATLDGLASQPDTSEAVDASCCCVICLSDISEPSAAQPCGHRNFDFMCLASWMSLKTTCPLCKTEISEVHFDFNAQATTWKTYRVPRVGLERAPEQPTHSSAAQVNPALSNVTTFLRRARDRRPFRNTSQRTTQPRPAQDPLERRRNVYRKELYSLHVGSSPASGYRDITPLGFSRQADTQSRARAWIRRELQVFEFLNDDSSAQTESADSALPETTRRRRQNNAEFVLEYIIAILKTVDIQSDHTEELLKDFLGRDHTKLFLHELRNFLRSPYSVEAWDRQVQYAEPRASPRSLGGRSAPGPRVDQGPHRRLYDRYRPSGSSRRGGRWSPYRQQGT
ncbi:hypothetical protein J7T55_003640 [Diaporthe amygdali]|uniref:uncharacterized protein n=1 Tax=Phomopsis amygdali TaxID=1214568 RepID=UPI0022FE36EC|nr:uncharacterized protein J7T55_003640 [Diaporthe amygdali]KAJ0117230.1 hypothetical protein J7T55_003640 [Diaporthe amygdali]